MDLVNHVEIPWNRNHRASRCAMCLAGFAFYWPPVICNRRNKSVFGVGNCTP